MQLVRRRGENRTRIRFCSYAMRHIGGDFAKTRPVRAIPPPLSLSPISIPNPFKTLCYSCLDIVKPHFQHRHYVKHVAKADKSNNGFGASTATEGGTRGLRTFRSPTRIDLVGRSIDRPSRPLFVASRIDLSSPGANFVIGGKLAKLVGGARTLIMLSRY